MTKRLREKMVMLMSSSAVEGSAYSRWQMRYAEKLKVINDTVKLGGGMMTLPK